MECTEILTNKARRYNIGRGKKALSIIDGRRKNGPISTKTRKYSVLLVGASRTQCVMGGIGWNPGEGEIFCTCPDCPWGPFSLLCNGYRVILGGKAAGVCR